MTYQSQTNFVTVGFLLSKCGSSQLLLLSSWLGQPTLMFRQHSPNENDSDTTPPQSEQSVDRVDYPVNPEKRVVYKWGRKSLQRMTEAKPSNTFAQGWITDLSAQPVIRPLLIVHANLVVSFHYS